MATYVVLFGLNSYEVRLIINLTKSEFGTQITAR